MQAWYNSTNKKQKILLWGVSALLIMVYGSGLVGLAILSYLEFGSNKD